MKYILRILIKYKIILADFEIRIYRQMSREENEVFWKMGKAGREGEKNPLGLPFNYF
ncbi:hypothetical protein HF394_17480 [Planococcus glaciei]|uniref:Uncharacterized protein n=1 Tax=Planococcus glaciei TaxID=459472 RepID=A0A7H8QE40_9BACL|nr:hypothetical protein [Planococcus glaciei]QKX52220.1 hypothetical protein HF394_17480 [Planococcus glaciei]